MGKTFAEKILAQKSRITTVTSGEIIDVSPDYVMSHDNTAAISKTLYKTGVDKVKEPDKLVIILDHCVPAATEKYADNHKVIREFVKKQKIKNFFDINTGICHQVLPEKGFALPGKLILGSDSHTTTYGAFGAFSTGIGRSEMAVIYATGKLWLRVPETIKINISGTFPSGIFSKDLILKIIGDIGADGALYKAVEFCGNTVKNMSLPSRMVMTNMAVEMGAKIGYIEPDEKVFTWIEERKQADYEVITSDNDAVFESILNYNVDKLEPHIAAPHTVDNVYPVDKVKGKIIHQALLGTCTNGRLEDLAFAAKILKNKKIHSDVRLLIFPASFEIYREALSSGVADILLDSGGILMNPGCGPCLGAHEGALAPGEVCISTANRNFKGRMGCNESEVYLASPATVAASALTGKITDFREIL